MPDHWYTVCAVQACRSFNETWLGLTPLYLVHTTSLICWLFVFMPRTVHRPAPVLQVRIQAECLWPAVYNQLGLPLLVLFAHTAS